MSDVEQKLWPALQASASIWPAAICLNIAYVPIDYRVLFVNVVGLGYGMLMNWMANWQRERAKTSTLVRHESNLLR